ncbi:hypothetical protein H8D36_01515 [archaeon]|nr:hypothetical protein [archaeon]
MSKKIILALLAVVIVLTACNSLETGEDNMIIGEVIEIIPGNDTTTDNSQNVTDFSPITGPDNNTPDYSDELVRIEGTEGDLITLKKDAYDPDGDTITYSFTEPFNEDGEWQTKEGDVGDYLITKTASDGKFSTSVDVLVIIKSTNRAPVIECEDELTFKETDLIELGCNIYDPEGEDLNIKYVGWLTDETYQTDYDDEGSYSILITASDGEKITSKNISIEITNLNRPPIAEDIGVITVEETDLIMLNIEAEDPDGDDLTFKFEYPLNVDGEWQTNYGDAKTYESSVMISDGTGATKMTFSIVVTQKNTPPNLDFIPSIIIDEGQTITLPISTFDREGANLTITISGWFNTVSYTTTFDDAGNHSINVSVDDGELVTIQEVEIIVNDVGRPPVWI